MYPYCVPIVKKEKQLKARLSKARYFKLAQYAVSRDRTITSLIEDWIDSLPNLGS